jgi:CDP-glucose 4,6-dehydratase
MGQRKSTVENVVMNTSLESFYRGKSVFITGHTGFKGGWLATWLKMLGARVIGFSLPPEEGKPNLFEAAHVSRDMISLTGDIRDYVSLAAALDNHRPEILFHLAAQPLVRRSYRQPVETYSTNVMGTVHVLEAVRQTPSVRIVEIITSDKCYDNRECIHAYREDDSIGGYEPYSASKAAAELVVASYRNSFFRPERYKEHGVSVASVRAGNVIGGGDWSEDRLIPDCVKSLVAGRRIPVRNPEAIRPWQHVLEPLCGYLWLAVCMSEDPTRHAGAWNFGPSAAGNIRVRDAVSKVLQEWGSGEWDDVSELNINQPHEATFLKLDCTKAASLLEWTPVWSISQTIPQTVKWYRGYYFDPDFDGYAFSIKQIEAYVQMARKVGAPWTSKNGEAINETWWEEISET